MVLELTLGVGFSMLTLLVVVLSEFPRVLSVSNALKRTNIVKAVTVFGDKKKMSVNPFARGNDINRCSTWFTQIKPHLQKA